MSLIDMFYNTKNNDDWDTSINKLIVKYNSYNVAWLKKDEILKRLAYKEEWDGFDINYIKHRLEQHDGPVLDELFLKMPCGEFYRLLRIETFNQKQITLPVNRLPKYYTYTMFIILGIMLFLMGIGIFTVTTFIVKL